MGKSRLLLLPSLVKGGERAFTRVNFVNFAGRSQSRMNGRSGAGR